MSTQTGTSDNRLLAVVMKHGVRLAQVIGPATIQPEYWPAVHLAMLGAIEDAAVVALPAKERLELAFIADFLQRNCEDRRLVSAPISDQVMDLIALQQDQLEALRTTNDRQATRIEALLATVKAQDEEIAACSMRSAPSTAISVATALSAPDVNGISHAADPMPQPESTPVSTDDPASAGSASPATGRQRRREGQPRAYSAEMKQQLQAQVVARLRTLMAERSAETMSIHDFEVENPDLPSASAFTKTLGVKWAELVTAAGGVPLERGPATMNALRRQRQAREVTAATPAVVPFPGANGAGE